MLSLPINDQLKNLLSWQQSVFCMALSEHTKLHFHLFCEAIENEAGTKINNEIDKFNQLFWEKMTVKGVKVNLTIQQEHFDEIIPDSRKHDFYGVYPAIDHCVILSCAFNSFLIKSNDEALNASQTSFSTIASFIELQSGDELDDEMLQEQALFIEQLEFQTELLKMLDNERSPELIKSIQHFVQAHGVTNLGIALSE
ncbi:YjaG family protein [Psychromonas hadalis]|uniref:YjaG family protein n=1 Tax=Psychromonas hadalis TaxID=211669 RepID=UPI0003B492D1|nr:YjaG family protein [Psychromonas hadalis]